MDSDLVFVVGCIVSVLSIPAFVSAFSDGRTPRYPALMIAIGVAMIFYATQQRPGAYTFDTVVDVFMRVVGRLIG